MGETARGVPLPPPLRSLLTQNREHIPLSQGHHDEGGGGRRREGEENTWRTEHGCCCRCSPNSTFPPSSPPFFLRQSPLPPPFLYSSSCCLSLFPFFFLFFPHSPSAPPLYLLSGHLLHVNSLCDDKRLSDDSPVRDCKKKKKGTTHHTQFT